MPVSYHSRGNALRALRRYREALSDYDKAFALQPGLDLLHGDLVNTRRMICDWAAAPLPALERRISDGHAAATPFILLGLSDLPALHRKAAEAYVRDRHPASDHLPAIAKRAASGKIRLGCLGGLP